MGYFTDSGASLPSGPDSRHRRVFYFYEPTIGDYEYQRNHPMRPIRIRMTHNLIVKYNLHRHFQTVRPFPATTEDISRFHTQDYVDFLSTVSPQSIEGNACFRKLRRFNLDQEDCPIFNGLFDFSQASAGGSIGAAAILNRGDADIAINWAGGLHHAKKREAAGFCYINDIVLGILELLKVHRRVLYVDIDAHHGDGVEEAFYTTDRVMTVSFHKYGDGYFPGTGHILDTGSGPGKNYSLNVPLQNGMDDDSFNSLFRAIIQAVMDVYQPDAVVLQCGADSLSGDKLGPFNLSVKGHADSLRFLRSFNVPLMVLGGGGYTVQNVARCWCYETAVAVGVEPDDNLPYNDYYDNFGPDYSLHVKPRHRENRNTPEDLELTRILLLEQLSRLPHAPSVPFQTTPSTTEVPEEEEEDLDRRPHWRHPFRTEDSDSDSET
ncbi:hypothetical protein QN277_025567 [Acacia crassicarpa]|uniref:Histone deacetylase n=1 Tax=Acacia crassicarpa TaxID=499986 RepID=A0AAE1J5V9_9FABA|nr:hypothetical protein QN277_025567 [Acacia crassicarpa]